MARRLPGCHLHLFDETVGSDGAASMAVRARAYGATLHQIGLAASGAQGSYIYICLSIYLYK